MLPVRFSLGAGELNRAGTSWSGETAPPLMVEGGMQLNHGRINTGSKMEIGHWCDSFWW